MTIPDNGIVSIAGQYSVEETVERLKGILQAKEVTKERKKRDFSLRSEWPRLGEGSERTRPAKQIPRPSGLGMTT